MGNSFVLFDVSIVISRGQFHCGNIGHTQNTHSPWVKSYFPEGKRASGTATIHSLRVVQFFPIFCLEVEHVRRVSWTAGLHPTFVKTSRFLFAFFVTFLRFVMLQ